MPAARGAKPGPGAAGPCLLPEEMLHLKPSLRSSLPRLTARAPPVQVATGGHWFEVATSPPSLPCSKQRSLAPGIPSSPPPCSKQRSLAPGQPQQALPVLKTTVSCPRAPILAVPVLKTGAWCRHWTENPSSRSKSAPRRRRWTEKPSSGSASVPGCCLDIPDGCRPSNKLTVVLLPGNWSPMTR